MNLSRKSAGIIPALLAFWQPNVAAAHPHAWISVRTQVIVNDKNEAVALREHWLFDRFYTAYATADLHPKNGKFSESDLLPLAHENIGNLKEYTYFTIIEDAGGKRIKTGDAQEIGSAFEVPPREEKKKVVVYAPSKDDPPVPQDGKQISMSFTLPLKTPLPLSGKGGVYRIFDPTYYVDMSHYEHNAVTFVSEKDGTPRTGCKADVVFPKIDQSMIFSAAALDRNAKAPQDLGYVFSEKVVLTCSQPN